MKWTGDDRPPPAGSGLSSLAGTLPAYGTASARAGSCGPADGPPVLVIPGFLATDRTTMALRKALADAGWRVHPWGLGLNSGVREDTLHKLEACVDAIGAKEPILVVGWSLGGLYARELARHAPSKCARS